VALSQITGTVPHSGTTGTPLVLFLDQVVGKPWLRSDSLNLVAEVPGNTVIGGASTTVILNLVAPSVLWVVTELIRSRSTQRSGTHHDKPVDRMLS